MKNRPIQPEAGTARSPGGEYQHWYTDPKTGLRIWLNDHTPDTYELKWGNGDSYMWAGSNTK